MTQCRIGWPYERCVRLIDQATRKPLDLTGETFEQVIFEQRGGAVLARWNSDTGFIRAVAGGRIQWAVPAFAMAAPLRAGTFPTELRRSEGRVVFSGLIRIGGALQP